MKIKNLITWLESFSLHKDVAYLDHLKQLDPNKIVLSSHGGECERDGVYAPFRKDGSPGKGEARPFRHEEPFPDDGQDWIQVGYLPEPRNYRSPSH